LRYNYTGGPLRVQDRQVKEPVLFSRRLWRLIINDQPRISPTTSDESPLMRMSELAAVPTPPVLESPAKGTKTDQDGVVSETMREEEKKMKSASAKEEEKRIQKTHGELQGEAGLNGTAVDERFLKLDRLLSQSKVELPFCSFESFQRNCWLGGEINKIEADTLVI